jgi:hypothetical protein
VLSGLENLLLFEKTQVQFPAPMLDSSLLSITSVSGSHIPYSSFCSHSHSHGTHRHIGNNDKSNKELWDRKITENITMTYIGVTCNYNAWLVPQGIYCLY